MNPFQYLKEVDQLPSAGGDGYRVAVDVTERLRTTGGLILTAATVPTIAATETNGLAIVAAASGTASGSFIFRVPQDYDETSDELKILALVASGGDTDTPTLTATAYRKRAGAALTAALTVTASDAVPNSTAKAAVRTIDLSSNSLRGGDVLTINLVAGAHTTDSLVISSVAVQYRTGVVFQTESER